MGMEAPVQYGGSDFSFISTILAIEELAKVDASVAVVVDIHNTLLLRLFKILGTSEQKEKYLTLLATKGVSDLSFIYELGRKVEKDSAILFYYRLAAFVCQNLTPDRMHFH